MFGAIKCLNLARFSPGPCNKVPTPSHGRERGTCSALVPTDCHLTTLNNVCCTSIYNKARKVVRLYTSDTPADRRLSLPVSPWRHHSSHSIQVSEADDNSAQDTSLTKSKTCLQATGMHTPMLFASNNLRGGGEREREE